jgi:hypothetical protein
MATLPKVLINRADYQIGGGVALRLRTQGAAHRVACQQRRDQYIALALKTQALRRKRGCSGPYPRRPRKDLARSLEGFCVGGLGPQKSFQSSGAAERNAAYPTSGTLLVRATGTGTNGRDMHAYRHSSAA